MATCPICRERLKEIQRLHTLIEKMSLARPTASSEEPFDPLAGIKESIEEEAESSEQPTEKFNMGDIRIGFHEIHTGDPYDIGFEEGWDAETDPVT
jgi:hypothetical protein